MRTLLQDLRYGLRVMLKSKAFTAVAVLSLALGIGANTTIFSLVNATLLRQLPVQDPARLVYLYSGVTGDPYSRFSYPDFAEMREQNQVFSGLAAFGGISASLNAEDETDIVGGAIVTGNYFDVLGVRAALGRTISPDDDRTPGAHPVVVLSHGLWQRRFGGDRGIINRQITLNGQQFTVIGVTPPEFGGAEKGVARDLYVPMMMQALMRPPRGGYSGEMNPDLLNVRRNRWLLGVGRLKESVSFEQAASAMSVIAKQQETAYPDTNAKRIVTLTRLTEGDPTTRGSLVSVAGLLFAVVGLVLLIACANVANLLLARSSARRKEIALRLALGAGRARLVRQLLTESILLALAGGAVGLALAWWMGDVLKATQPPPALLPVAPDFALDWRVLAFTLGLSALTGIVFGLAPALRASRPDLLPALKDESAVPDSKGRLFNLRNGLVVLQVALSLLLLIGSGLFLRSFWRAQAIEPGFAVDKILTVPLNINLLRYTKAQGREYYRQAIERVESLPGVESASLARIVALSGGGSIRGLLIEGSASQENVLRSESGGGMTVPDSDMVISVNVVSERYLETMGIGLLLGRDFGATDIEGRPNVAIVNEAFVRRHLEGQNALGRRFSFGQASGPWYEIIGVARDSKYTTLGEKPTPQVYVPLAQNHETGMTLHVRTAGDPASLAAAVRRELQAIDRNVPVTSVTTMTELLSNSLYSARMGAALLGAFGLLALLLAGVGLYGVMSYTVAQRTREIGIRMALGASSGDVLGMVLREALALVASGVALGLIASFALTRLLASFLYDIATNDAATFAGVPFVLAAVALLAGYLPARRATKVDPMIALRYE
jgi:predicted permease